MIVIMDDVVENLSHFRIMLWVSKKIKTRNGIRWTKITYGFLSTNAVSSKCLFWFIKMYWMLNFGHIMIQSKTWHLDKDEQLKIKQGITRFPLCSMVYYVMVDNLRGNCISKMKLSHQDK